MLDKHEFFCYISTIPLIGGNLNYRWSHENQISYLSSFQKAQFVQSISTKSAFLLTFNH